MRTIYGFDVYPRKIITYQGTPIGLMAEGPWGYAFYEQAEFGPGEMINPASKVLPTEETQFPPFGWKSAGVCRMEGHRPEKYFLQERRHNYLLIPAVVLEAVDQWNTKPWAAPIHIVPFLSVDLPDGTSYDHQLLASCSAGEPQMWAHLLRRLFRFPDEHGYPQRLIYDGPAHSFWMAVVEKGVKK